MFLDTSPAAKGFFANLLDGLTGNKVIADADLDAPLQQYKVKGGGSE